MRTSTRAFHYLLFEMIPSFLIGLIVFIFIILMFQTLRYTEFVLIHGVGLETIGRILFYITISLLPALLPMALLFSVLMTFGRLSADSEIVAFKASGISMATLAAPALLLGGIVTFFSMKTSFSIAPWGNRQFELLITELGQTKASATIREGSFSEGFFNLVVYANKVDTKTGQLQQVFIFDERNEESPLTIIAKEGLLIQGNTGRGLQALLRLDSGDIHKPGASHTKINFQSFDISLFEGVERNEKSKSLTSLTMDEITERIQSLNQQPEEQKSLQADIKTEFHKRWSISFVCLIFAFLGVGLGTSTNRRQKSNGMVNSLIIVIIYWVLFVGLEGTARSEQLAPWLAMWLPNLLFTISGIYFFRKSWN